MLLSVHVNAFPTELLNSDEGLVDMAILRHHVGTEVKRKTLGVKDVGRCFGKVCADGASESGFKVCKQGNSYGKLCSSLQSADVCQHTVVGGTNSNALESVATTTELSALV